MLKSHCKYGHPFDEENTAHRPGRRRCKECVRRQARADRARKRLLKGTKPVIPLRAADWVPGVEYEVRHCGYITPCWVWLRAVDADGYASVHTGTRTVGGHRVMFERVHGPISLRLHLHHECENPSCVNPDHLTPLTHRDHMERHGRRVLGDENAAEIKQRLAAGESAHALAREYGVTSGSINHIRMGRSYVAA